jgi:hypothetical protein
MTTAHWISLSGPVAVLCVANAALGNINIEWVGQPNGFTAAEATVIKQAISQWESLIEDMDGLPGQDSFILTITKAPESGIGLVNDYVEDMWGIPLGAGITIDDGTYANPLGGFFVDPTPKSHTEFWNTANPYYGAPKPGSPAFGKFDLLTVMKHEIGHALGFAEDYSLWDAASDDVTGLLTYGPGLTAQLLGLYHLDHPTHKFDLMAAGGDLPTDGIGDRRSVSPLDLEILAGIYGYQVNPENLKPKIPGAPTISLVVIAGLVSRRHRRR